MNLQILCAWHILFRDNSSCHSLIVCHRRTGNIEFMAGSEKTGVGGIVDSGGPYGSDCCAFWTTWWPCTVGVLSIQFTQVLNWCMSADESMSFNQFIHYFLFLIQLSYYIKIAEKITSIIALNATSMEKLLHLLSQHVTTLTRMQWEKCWNNIHCQNT